MPWTAAMRQLTSLDAQFLALENERTHGHVGTLAVYDPSTAPSGLLTVEDVRQLVRERIHLIPPFRWRLMEVPLHLDHPYWVEEPDADLEYHVREVALPAPGDLRQLAEQSARIFERRLDRSHPLWEMYVIQGVALGARVAVLTKVHHAALDGLSGAELLAILLDLEPSGRDVPPRSDDMGPEDMPGTAGLVARSVTGATRRTLHAVEKLPETLPNLDIVPTLRSVPGVNMLASAARGITGRLPGHEAERHVPHLVAPATSLNRRISAHRRLAFQTISLTEVKRIKNRFGVTVNDVVVAISAGAVRRWLIAHDDLPDDPLLAMVPVSVRLPEESGTFGNRVSMMVVPIPTNEEDTAERLRAAHDALEQAKGRHRLTPRMLMEEASEAIPPVILNAGAKVLLGLAGLGLPHPPLNLVISNVPGSRMPLYMHGARMEAQYPLSILTDSMGLNMTIMSYLDRIDFGIVGDREEVPDVWLLAEAVREEFEALRALA